MNHLTCLVKVMVSCDQCKVYILSTAYQEGAEEGYLVSINFEFPPFLAGDLLWFMVMKYSVSLKRDLAPKYITLIHDLYVWLQKLSLANYITIICHLATISAPSPVPSCSFAHCIYNNEQTSPMYTGIATT